MRAHRTPPSRRGGRHPSPSAYSASQQSEALVQPPEIAQRAGELDDSLHPPALVESAGQRAPVQRLGLESRARRSHARPPVRTAPPRRPPAAPRPGRRSGRSAPRRSRRRPTRPLCDRPSPSLHLPDEEGDGCRGIRPLRSHPSSYSAAFFVVLRGFLAGCRLGLFGLDDGVSLGRGIRDLLGLFDDLFLSVVLVVDGDEAAQVDRRAVGVDDRDLAERDGERLVARDLADHRREAGCPPGAR